MDEKRLQEIEAMIATNADPEEVRYADEAWGLNEECLELIAEVRRMNPVHIGWIRRLPAQPGWYWYRNTEEGGQIPWVKKPVVFEVIVDYRSEFYAWAYRMDYKELLTAENFPGEWAGPIEPPV